MRILIVGSSTEGQARYAKMIENFNASELESLDLTVKLASLKEYMERVETADVLVLGSDLADQATGVARNAQNINPKIRMIMFVDSQAYSCGAFRAAHYAGVRKVLSDNAPELDFLQEIVGIHAEFRREGRAQAGKLVVITSPKGAAGTTSITAALGELCSDAGKKTLLWDMDYETRDLTRSLCVFSNEGEILSSWVSGREQLTRDNFSKALVDLSDRAQLLQPPHRIAESMDLFYHTDGITTIERIVELSRIRQDVIIVDAGSSLGPASGALMRMADLVLLVIGDCSLGLSAADPYLQNLNTLMGSMSKVRLLSNRSSIPLEQIANELDPNRDLGELAWSLPEIGDEGDARFWAGSGKTLYSSGSGRAKFALEKIAFETGITDFLNSDRVTAPAARRSALDSARSFIQRFRSQSKSEALSGGLFRGNSRIKPVAANAPVQKIDSNSSQQNAGESSAEASGVAEESTAANAREARVANLH